MEIRLISQTGARSKRYVWTASPARLQYGQGRNRIPDNPR